MYFGQQGFGAIKTGDNTRAALAAAFVHVQHLFAQFFDASVRALQFILDTPSFTGSTLLVDGGQHFDSRNRDVMFDPAVRKDAKP